MCSPLITSSESAFGSLTGPASASFTFRFLNAPYVILLTSSGGPSLIDGEMQDAPQRRQRQDVSFRDGRTCIRRSNGWSTYTRKLR